MKYIIIFRCLFWVIFKYCLPIIFILYIITVYIKQLINIIKIYIILINEKYLEKELCTSLITSELLRASPLILASKLWQKFLNSSKFGPNDISECLQFNNTLKIACVAHALLITYKLFSIFLSSDYNNNFNNKITTKFNKKYKNYLFCKKYLIQPII